MDIFQKKITRREFLLMGVKTMTAVFILGIFPLRLGKDFLFAHAVQKKEMLLKAFCRGDLYQKHNLAG